jgi:periplasmic copper chaperone A
MGLIMRFNVNPILGRLLIAFFLTGAACSPGVPQIRIEEPEAKLSPVILGVASVFLKIVNSGNGDDRLLSARTDIPGALSELHDEKDGKMTTIAGMDVPAKSTLLLRPAGKHIMLFRLPRTMQTGTEFRIILTFQRSGERTLAIKLTDYATKAPRARYH